MVVRAPVDSDPAVRHLWVGETTTACGYTGHRGAGWAPSTCVACLERYGAELAAAFSHLKWLSSEIGMTCHAFDDTEPRTADGARWPVCHMRPYSPDQLSNERLAMRCPHCLERLRQMRDRARAPSASDPRGAQLHGQEQDLGQAQA
jgi:hypothetical protein